MITLVRPCAARIDACLARAHDQPFSYRDVGATRDAQAPAGFVADRRRVCLGQGQEAFDAARDRLRRWEMFRLGWVTICPDQPALVPGTVVASLARLGVVWWLNPCRIIYVDEGARRFCFAYGTLRGHAEIGEERFSVEWLDDDSVWYELYAFSRAGHWLTRVGYPLARLMQRRFGRQSLAAMAQAVKQAVTP
jgi:uncharacterized protein (UPF0548 family)